jgi:hypothetical protein
VTAAPELTVLGGAESRVVDERKRQRLVMAFIVTGIFFMLLPGTFLGVWNLIGISESRDVSSLPQAWLQAHGQAQIFGWIGSFILGIGFYSLTRILTGRPFPALMGWLVWFIWTVGISLRWLAGIEDWGWRVLLPVSAASQLTAYVLFYVTLRKNGPRGSGKPEVWMRMVAAATVAFFLTLVVNFGILLHQAATAPSPALPHVLDEEFVVLAIWGILVPTIWGFNARWLPTFIGAEKPGERRLLAAYGASIAGVVATFVGALSVASVAFLIAAVLAIDALHVWERPLHPAKILNIHPSFPIFIRLCYFWLLISCVMALMAVPLDTSGGVWGGSRHALTVGFVATMVFAIGQRVLPAFCGMRILWSKQLMFWSLFLLTVGCVLRVLSEPLAYEGIWKPAWKILPYSAGLELTAVALFGLNLIVTFFQPPAHVKAGARS